MHTAATYNVLIKDQEVHTSCNAVHTVTVRHRLSGTKRGTFHQYEMGFYLTYYRLAVSQITLAHGVLSVAW